MSDTYIAIGEHRLSAVKLVVGNKGPWYADCDFEDKASTASGRVTLKIGELSLSGTIDTAHDGTFGEQRKCRVVAGAGGWDAPIGSKSYHNDALVKARAVAEDAASLVGETIGTFVPRKEKLAADYVRQVGAASLALEDAAGGAAWWVDYDGVTHVGPRASSSLESSTYEVLAYEPDEKIVTLAVDNPGAVRIGAVLSERLDAPATIRDFTLSVTATELRIVAWCGGNADGHGRLPGLLRSLVEHTVSRRLLGKYRYRVFAMADDRVNLQAVRKAAGVPDLMHVDMWPGMSGTHAVLTPGSEVLVEFVEGDRSLPIVTHFCPKGSNGFAPVSLSLAGGSRPVACIGDTVDVLFPPLVPFTGLVNGSTPIAGTMQMVAAGVGIVKTGSNKVTAP